MTNENAKAQKEHWERYIVFCQKHPEILTDELDPTHKEKLWKSLTTRLNGLGLCQKTEEEWKKSIRKWKKKTETKARDRKVLLAHEEEFLELIAGSRSSEKNNRKVDDSKETSAEATASRTQNVEPQTPTNADLQKQMQEILQKLDALSLDVSRIAAIVESYETKPNQLHHQDQNKRPLKSEQGTPKVIIKQEAIDKKASGPYHDSSELKIYYQNINGLKGVKEDFLEAVSSSDTYDVIAITETHLDSTDKDEELFDPSKFTVFRTDRSQQNNEKKSWGGVLVAVRKHVSAVEIKLTNTTTEEIWVSLSYFSSLVIFGLVYFPSYKRVQKYKDFFVSVETVMSPFPESTSKIILGDFNLPQIKWEARQDMLIPKGVIHGEAFGLINRLPSLGLHQRNNVRNARDQILDLIYTNTKEVRIGEVSSVLDEKVQGDHPPLKVSVKVYKGRPRRARSLGRSQ